VRQDQNYTSGERAIATMMHPKKTQEALLSGDASGFV
jgi:hypothetical protein